MPIRLRYLSHDLEVPAGQFVIGRTPDCQLSLDDPLVSRRHALLVVQPNGVFVEDLGARNGVFVNGSKIDKIQRLHDGDVIKIGSQEMTLQGVDDPAAQAAAEARHQHHRTRTMQDLQAFVDPDDAKHVDTATAAVLAANVVTPDPAAIAAAAAALKSKQTETRLPAVTASAASAMARELRAPTPVVQYTPQEPDPEDATVVTMSPVMGVANPDRRVSALSLIGGLADKALAMGRAEEAERILSRTLIDVRDRALRGELHPADLTERAAAYAVRLAAATGKGEWVDYIFLLYCASRRLLPAKIVDEVYAAARRVKQTDRSALRAYTSMLRELEGGFGPADKFVQQRIDGLERFIP